MTTNEDVSTPRGRRERPAKQALTRQGIIDAALVIMREEGLNKLTMRRIAAALDTGPASLYVYVRNTEDLHAQILDALLAPVSATAAGTGPWRDRLKALLRSYQQVLFAHPEIARMALSTHPSGPNYLALVEVLLGLLREGGVTGRARAWGLDVLLLYPTAVAVEHSGPRTPSQEQDEFSALSSMIASVDRVRYPNIAESGQELTSGEGSARSDWALDVLLDGIVAAQGRNPAD
jgi:AcrR family transcriptional regulator